MQTEIVPNAQLLSPVSPSPGPPRTQSQSHFVTIKRAPKRADTDPIALPPANPEPLPARPAAPPGQSTNTRTSPQRNTSAINSPAPAPAPAPVPAPTPAHVLGPEPEPADAVDIDPSPSRQNSAHNSAHSMTSASTAPSQVLKTPSDLAQEPTQEQEQLKLPPESKSSTTLARAPKRVDERAAGEDMPPVVIKTKTKRRDGSSRASRHSHSSHVHEHEHRHGKEQETGEDMLPSPESKKNDIVQVLVKRGEKSRKDDVSDAPASTANAHSPVTQPPTPQRSPSPQPPSQQLTAQQSPVLEPPKPTPIPSPAPSKPPPSAARALLPMHVPSRRRQASSPISKSEVEAARALGVVLFYPLEKHINDPGLLEELLAYLSFHEFMTLNSTSKRIRAMLEDRKELREAVLGRYLATVGYTRWEFEIKEPLELTIKVCIRPSFRERCFLRGSFPSFHAGSQFLSPRRVHPGPPIC